MTVSEAFQCALQHHQAGRLPEAEEIYRQILAVAPRHGDSLHLLGLIAHQVGRSDAGVELMRRAGELIPEDPAVHSNLGEAYRALGALDDAVEAYRRALPLQPEHSEARTNLGVALAAQGRLDEAIAEYERTLQMHPSFAPAHFNLGLALFQKGRMDDAVEAYRRALQFKPDFCAARLNLGNALAQQGRLDEAIACFRHVLSLQPGSLEARINLGSALSHQGALAEAIEAYRSVLRQKPDLAWVRSNLLGALQCPAGWPAEDIFREHHQWGEIHARPLANQNAAYGNDPDPERRLRVGYVSRDFREHSVAFFFEPLLTAHDDSQVEVFCYSDVRSPDTVTARLHGQAAHWREIAGLTDEQVATLIREDRIDLLVDLAGHTSGNRLLVFARKPAPVQVTYLGYCGTTGMPAMDYRLTDAWADPPGMTEHWHTEQLVRLPDSAWCFRPSEFAPPVGDPPVIRTGGVTFGCFNAQPKITDDMLAWWAKILLAVPDARLLLKNASLQNRTVQDRVRSLLAGAGVASERLELLERQPTMAEHLACYQRVDISLDTFPYHGTTTTCEALWMGVPVITLAGATHVSRVGVSLLNNVGLPELIAHTPEKYVGLAVELAGNPPRLSELRATLRGRMAASPLMDGPRFARHVEAAYRQMWRDWCMRSTSTASAPPTAG